MVAVYVLNQWDRYLLNYLSSVATKLCPTDDGGVCHVPKGVDVVSYCETCPANGTSGYYTQCQACHDCLADHNSPKHNLEDGTCITNTEYGFLAGYGFSFLYVIVGLFAGGAADRFSRRNIVGVALVAWSGAIALQGAAHNFGVLTTSRVLLGVAEAFNAPPAYSLIAAYYPKDQRATANGIYAFGVYVGGGLSSLSLLLASELGWRETSYGVAVLGVVVAVAFLLAVREPARKQESEEPAGDKVAAEGAPRPGSDDEETALRRPLKEAAGEAEGAEGAEEPRLTVVQSFRLMLQPVVLLVFLGSGLRFFGGYSIGTYLPIYYKRRFPDQNKQYAVLNAFVVSVGGAVSSYAGGRLSDRLTKDNPAAKALVPAIGAALGFAPFVGVMLFGNFYLSIACLLLEYLLAESWFGPTIAILQNTLPAQVHGLTIATYLFLGTLIGNLAPLLLGYLDPGTTRINLLVLLFVLISYGGTFVIFLIVASILKVKGRRSHDALLDAAAPGEGVGKPAGELRSVSADERRGAYGSIQGDE